MGNQQMGGRGAGRMTEEEKKKARERRQEECKSILLKINPVLRFREEKTRSRSIQNRQKEVQEEHGWWQQQAANDQPSFEV